MNADFPKLLVATEFPPNASGGGPAVVRQMLRCWPTQKLFWWSCLPELDQRFDRKVAAHWTARIPQKWYPNRRWCIQKSWLLEQVWTPWAARHLCRTIEKEKPDVIWLIPHLWSIPVLVRVMPQVNTGFHVSIHDYSDVHGNVLRFGPDRSRKMAAWLNQLYADAITRDAICQPMIDDLRIRTGQNGTIARAGLEREDFDYLLNKTITQCSVIRIAYAGTILVEKEFARFVQALSRIRQKLPIPVELNFFGSHSYRSREWFDSNWMREHGNLSAPQLSLALKNCTWGFAPMGLGDDDPRYNRFSLPTKFVSYLAAGLPVIIMGHPQSSIVKIAESYHVGPCATSENSDALDHELLAALSDGNPWAKYGSEILRCARNAFDMRQMRERLYECFRKCADKTNENFLHDNMNQTDLQA